MSVDSEVGKNYRAYRTGGYPSYDELMIAKAFRKLIGEERIDRVVANLADSNKTQEKDYLNSDRVPFFAEAFQKILDRVIGVPAIVRVDRETHAELDYALASATKALWSVKDGHVSLKQNNRKAREVFGRTTLPRIAHLITRPGAMEMVFRPNLGVNISTSDKYVEYRISTPPVKP